MKLNWVQIFVLKLVGKVLGIPNLVHIVRDATKSTEVFDLWEEPRIMPPMSDEDTIRRFYSELTKDSTITIRVKGEEPKYYKRLQKAAADLSLPILIVPDEDSGWWRVTLSTT